jgi:2-dehydro-3-deoxy-D-arabinonate dehydratase
MRLGQIKWHNNTTAAIFEADGTARPIPDYTTYDLIRLAEMERNPLAKVANRLASTHREPADPIIPISPKEVWACGCTYKQSSDFRDAEHGTREGFYAHVYREPRPEIFFKGTARVCVGPDGKIGLRSDAKFTAPEPELAVILGMWLATRSPMTSRRGISNARIRCTFPSRRSSPAAARWGRSSLLTMRFRILTVYR